MRMLRALAVSIALALPAVSTPLAVSPAVAQAQVELTEDMVKNLIASYPGVMEKADALQKKYGDANASTQDPSAALMALMVYGDAAAELNGVVTPFGFTDYMNWIQVLSAVATTYAYYKDGGIDSQMADAVKEIENNPNMTDAQKKVMLDQMKAASASMDAMRPPQASVDAVNAHITELDALFNQ